MLLAVIFGTILSCNNTTNSSRENSPIDTAVTADTVVTIANKNTPGVKTIIGQAGNLFVDDGGQGGIPVLFVHSFGGSTLHWQKQLAHLRLKRRAVAFDLRGHGQSQSPAGDDYEVASLADDIATVADSLRLHDFILVGHSMGGSAAIAYAATNPEKVAGLLVTGTPGKTLAAQSAQIIASLESSQYDTVMANYMNQLLNGARPATDSLERNGISKISKDASIDIIKAIFNYDPLPDMMKYPGPKLIVSTPAENQPNSLHRALPAIPYKLVKGTSHWIQLDKPDEFNEILDDFLKTVEKEKKIK